MSATHALALLAGAAIVTATVADLVSTLVVTRGLTGRLRLTRIVYRNTWQVWRAISRRFRAPGSREHFLALYGPLSLLSLLAVWLLALLLGWALVWTAFEDRFRNAGDFGDRVYFSGATLLTIGYGDIVPTTGLTRLLSLVEALTGLGTIALLISYLPALYGAYSRREARLMTLDDPAGERLTPIGLIAIHAPDGELDRLYRFFAEWELWTADVLESHGAYPMLALFRSQNPGQSWITALGVVLDAATLVTANVPGADRREPYFMHRRGRRTIQDVSLRLHLSPRMAAHLDRERFVWARTQLEEMGLPLHAEDEAWERLTSLRASYGQGLEDLIDFLVAPRGFWGLSSPVSEMGSDEVGQSLAHEEGAARGLGGTQALAAEGQEPPPAAAPTTVPERRG